MAVSPDEIAHLDQLITTLRRRQRLLETQRAGYGQLAAPAHITLELEDIARELPRHEAELRRLRPTAPADANPYLGLLTFQEADAARFFGRDVLVADLIERVRGAPFLVVLGASGSGKSSLVRAGLIPQLKTGAVEGSQGWRYAALKPGARPLDALAAELATLQGGQLDLALRLSGALTESDRALLLAADMLLEQESGQRLMILVDQFEELWTQASAEQRDQFIKLLLAATDAPDTPILIVLTMRADFLPRALEHRELAERIERHVALVSPMQPDELRDAIQRPAENAGGSFEPGLVEELIEQVQGQPGALPLLEYTLLELWRRCQADRLMNWAAYRALGGVEGALAARADQILSEHYSPEQQAGLRQILLRLVHPGEGAADTRRRARLEDLAPAGESLDAVQLLLKPLIDERLLTTGQDSASGEETVEISHEALLHAWPTFGRWISEARADLRFQLELEEDAEEWQDADRSDELLWRGLRLAEAEAWIERTGARLNTRDQAFLDASRAATEARRAAEESARKEREQLLVERAENERRNVSRLRIFLAAGAVLLVIAAGLAIYALNQTQVANEFAAQSVRSAELSATAEALARVQARVSNAQANAGESLFELGRGNADQGMLLARASVLTDTLQPLLAVRAIREATQLVVPSRSLHNHTQSVNAVAWSPDGKQALTGSADKTIKIWDAASSRMVTTLEGHTDSVWSVAWSPDGRQVLSGSADSTARIWDAASGQEIRTLEGHAGAVLIAVWSPDGKQVLSGSADGTARIWDAASGREIRTLEGHTGGVLTAAWSPDGKQALTGSDDSTARIWDVASGRMVTTLEGHTGAVLSAAWSPDGRQALTGSADSTARIWDAASGQATTTLEGHTISVWSVAWSPDGRQVLTGGWDSRAIIWDAASGQVAETLLGHTSIVTMVAWSPDGKQVLTSSQDQTAKIWDLRLEEAVRTLAEHTEEVNAVAWSPDGTQALTGSDDGTAKIWDVASGRVVTTLEDHADRVWSVVWSPDGTQVLTGSDDRTARIWDVASGGAIATLEGHAGGVLTAAWSPDGRQVLTGSRDKTARIWDVASGRVVASLVGHAGAVSTAVWSPDGKQVLTGSQDQMAKIWDVASGGAIATLEGHIGEINAVAWSPDGRQVLTGSQDKTARIWSASGELLTTLKGHTFGVWAVAWSPDGKQALTGSDDRTARIWDAASGQVVTTLEGHISTVTMVGWSPDGRQVLTGSADKTAKIWVADNDLIIADLTRRVCNVFTDDQIRAGIAAWRGCAVELAAIKSDLAAYDQLRPAR
jgi:WD40 repeat protein